jgi:hypothetical protein
MVHGARSEDGGDAVDRFPVPGQMEAAAGIWCISQGATGKRRNPVGFRP